MALCTVALYLWRVVLWHLFPLRFIRSSHIHHCTIATYAERSGQIDCIYVHYHITSARRDINWLRSTFFLHGVCMLRDVYGECAHEQHVRRTLTLTITHTITAYSVSRNVACARILIYATRQTPYRKRGYNWLLVHIQNIFKTRRIVQTLQHKQRTAVVSQLSSRWPGTVFEFPTPAQSSLFSLVPILLCYLFPFPYYSTWSYSHSLPFLFPYCIAKFHIIYIDIKEVCNKTRHVRTWLQCMLLCYFGNIRHRFIRNAER